MLIAIWCPKLVYAEFATVSWGVYRKPEVELEQSSLKGWGGHSNIAPYLWLQSGTLSVTVQNCRWPCDYTTKLQLIAHIQHVLTPAPTDASHYVRQHLHALNYFYPRSAGHRSQLPAIREVLPQCGCLEHRRIAVRCHSDLLICMILDRLVGFY